jgi:hypothetical protein
MRCPRCYADADAHSMSWFNTDEICLPCKKDESLAPGFADAKATETAAVQAGDYNFPGVGLSPADRAFLADLRSKRT